MSNKTTEQLTASQLANQAAHAICELNHRTHPGGDDLVYPADAAAIIATLAHMTGMLPQLLAQLARWLAHQHQNGHLRLDSLAPQPDLAQAMHTLTGSLQHASADAQHTAEKLDTAHQYAAHLATAQPAANDQSPNTTARGQNSCRSVGPNHLTKRTIWNIATTNTAYHDPGGDYFTRLHPQKARINAVRQLEAMGYHVTLEEAGPIADSV